MENEIERRQRILEALDARRFDTYANLAYEFEVSKMTIRRDIEVLSIYYPLYTTQGNGGGVHVTDGYSAKRKYLNDGQAELLKKLALTLSGGELETMQSIFKDFAKPKISRR